MGFPLGGVAFALVQAAGQELVRFLLSRTGDSEDRRCPAPPPPAECSCPEIDYQEIGRVVLAILGNWWGGEGLLLGALLGATVTGVGVFVGASLCGSRHAAGGRRKGGGVVV